ncbi:ABC transporter ATP-binding protein [Bordetella genomosp. 10]|uniref:ABC transporter ATP-binding protein n=1 Tax=Bordetella genomosp. 10 TaxID=1416804 RepID=A0A261SKI0_9BORD|nr:ABC transporter ATP-binding protein [Bordetella genomosp. 10]OZI37939.1 ABC transporter ATP-binding protein [Bordetella genomosp. 10]
MTEEHPRLLTVSGLTVSYDAASPPALDGVSLHIRPGEIVAVVGESGSGKSTLAAALTGLLPGNARRHGGIRFEDRDLAAATEKTWVALRGRRIGFVPQDPGLSLDPIQRIGVQLREALTVHGAPRRHAAQQVARLLAEVGLDDGARVAAGFPHELSGGMRQRALIAMAIANEPSLIVADEPTSALDVTVQRQVLDHLEGLARRKRIAVLLITHDLGVALDRADRIVVMRQGCVVETGGTAALFEDPRHPYTRALLAAAPMLAHRMPARSAHVPAVPAANVIALPPRPPRARDTDPPASPLLRLEGLTKVFPGGLKAVDDVSFEVPRHGTTGVVGESGSGKSTTARIALCLERPSAGRVLFDGQDVTHLSRGALRDFRRRVQVVYQNPYASLDPRYTLARIVAEPLEAYGVGNAASRRARAAALLEQVELSPALLDRRPAQLSGGQRQRVAIARALAIGPELVVLDEAVSALDVSVQARILDLLARLQRDLGVSYLFISHDLAVVRQISHRLVVLRAGAVVEQGPAWRVFEQPRHRYTQALLADSPGQRGAPRRDGLHLAA